MCTSLKQDFDVTLIAVHDKEEVRDGVHIIPFRRMHQRNLRVFLSWFFMFWKAIRVNAVVYHLHDPELIPCGLLLKLSGKKVIWDVHENIAEDIYDKHWIRNRKLAYNIFHFFEKLACRHFFILLAETSYEKRYHVLAKSCATVLNYCDLPFFEPYRMQRNKEVKHLFYIGIILENRGILQIIEALHLLKQRGEVFHFHCVGELYTDLNYKIMALPYYREIREQLHFHGRLPLEQGYKVATHCSIGLCIIWPMKNSTESYPTKLFEYMAIGLPVITSDFPLYRSVIEGNNCGICVDPYSSKNIADAISAIHNDVEKSEQMVKNGKEAVEKKYNWNSEKSVLVKVYKELAGSTK
jgi:glycosyltransferase involved in cell wall biosynthesis